MEKSNRFRLGVCIAVSVFSLYLLAPTMWSLVHPEQVDKMPGWMPKSAMKLGLDLQGGVHMVMGVDLDKVVVDQLGNYGKELEKALDKDGIKGVSSTVLADGFELEFTVPGAGDKDKVVSKILKDFTVLETVGETGNLLITRLTHGQEDYVRSHALDQSIETIRNRIDEFGVAEPIITRKGDSQILVQFPGAKEPERLKALIGQTAQLSFQIVHECRDSECLAKQRADLGSKIHDAEEKGKYTRESFKRLSEYRNKINEDLKDKLPPETTVAFERERNVNVNNSTKLLPYLLSTKNTLSGQYIEEAYVRLDKGNRLVGPERPVVNFRMNAVGAPLLGNLTTDFRGYYMAIVLDGVVKSAPTIQTPITEGSGQITLGSASPDEAMTEARDTAIVLRAGALPAQIEVQEERVIGPSMGRDAIESGKKALVVACIVIFAFMWAYYGWSGLLANFVTIINLALIFAVLGSLGATLTLPGIAGIVLTIGISVDALIIIFERMREEMRAGRHARQVVELGFDHAFATILDSNVTTGIGAFVLLQYGTGSIRGFALTLIVGIFSNVFMATFFMQTLFRYFVKSQDTKIGIGLPSKELAELHA